MPAPPKSAALRNRAARERRRLEALQQYHIAASASGGAFRVVEVPVAAPPCTDAHPIVSLVSPVGPDTSSNVGEATVPLGPQQVSVIEQGPDGGVSRPSGSIGQVPAAHDNVTVDEHGLDIDDCAEGTIIVSPPPDDLDSSDDVDDLDATSTLDSHNRAHPVLGPVTRSRARSHSVSTSLGGLFSDLSIGDRSTSPTSTTASSGRPIVVQIRSSNRGIPAPSIEVDDDSDIGDSDTGDSDTVDSDIGDSDIGDSTGDQDFGQDTSSTHDVFHGAPSSILFPVPSAGALDEASAQLEAVFRPYCHCAREPAVRSGV